MQPGVFTTTGLPSRTSYNKGSYNQGSYNQDFLQPGVLQQGFLTTRGLTTRFNLTTRGSYTQGSYNQWFLQPAVLQLGVLTTHSLTTRGSYNQRSYDQGFSQPGVLRTRGLPGFLFIYLIASTMTTMGQKTRKKKNTFELATKTRAEGAGHTRERARGSKLRKMRKY